VPQNFESESFKEVQCHDLTKTPLIPLAQSAHSKLLEVLPAQRALLATGLDICSVTAPPRTWPIWLTSGTPSSSEQR
jgi:hypothetical protein